ncbi:MAG: hypothetical protein WAP57_02695 [Aquabacterium commune]|uniref:hypothetical protein n=1 Tax=Aquabacterium commune TaxID=70586 RepID=UPI003BB0915D
MKQDLFLNTDAGEGVSLCISTVEVVCPDEVKLLAQRQGLRPGSAEPSGPALVLRLAGEAMQPLVAHAGAEVGMSLATTCSRAGQQLLVLFVQVGSVQLRLLLEGANTETMRLVGDALATRRLQFLLCSTKLDALCTFHAAFRVANAAEMASQGAESAWLSLDERCVDMAEATAQLAIADGSGVMLDKLTRHVVVAAQAQPSTYPDALLALVNACVQSVRSERS